MGHALPMSKKRSALGRRLDAGEIVLIDGATGTDIERRGVPMVENGWCGVSSLSHPGDVRAVHRAHIDAGAELVITNTYASSRHLLAWAGHEADFVAINHDSVRLAIEAREAANRPEVLVAGSISTSRQGGPYPDLGSARFNFAEQARILADAGADLIVLEMMRDIPYTELCLEAAIATDLPIWLGISCVAGDDGAMWMYEKDLPLAEFLEHFAAAPVEVLAVMHTEVDDIDGCLDITDDHWSGPIGVYAQTGRFEPPRWVFIDTISPEDYTAACRRWIERGVQAVGGCCGIGHEHIAHLHRHLLPPS